MPEAILQSALYPVVSRAIYAMTALGIPDILKTSSRSAADLSLTLGVKERYLRQILRLVSTTDLLQTENDGRFSLTESGKFLQSGHPQAAKDFILTLGGPTWYKGLGATLEVLRTERPGIEIANGKPLFEYYASNPEEAESFNRMMVAIHGSEPEAVASAYNFAQTGHVVDIGGGIGGMLTAVLTSSPDNTGTLFDLPHVITAAKEALADSAVSERCQFAEGDFFSAVPEGGDTYLLSHIIHDWDDDDSVRILQNCKDAMNPDGRVILVEFVVPENDDPHLFKILDVMIGICCNGSERTESEYADLARAAGLRLTRVTPTNSLVSIIELEVAR
nr:methyltransferase [Streptomyces chartreusis]